MPAVCMPRASSRPLGHRGHELRETGESFVVAVARLMAIGQLLDDHAGAPGREREVPVERVDIDAGPC